MGRLIKLLVILVIIIVGYNYFFGSSDEKSSSGEIIEKTKDLGSSIIDLLKGEKEKLDEGKYDPVFKKIDGLFESLGRKLNLKDQREKEELERLTREREALESQLKNTEKQLSPGELEEIENRINNLVEEAQKLLDEN